MLFQNPNQTDISKIPYFYFERKGDTDHRNFIPTEVFLDFLFGFSEPALARVLYGQWGRTRKTGPPFFIGLFKEKRKGSRFNLNS